MFTGIIRGKATVTSVSSTATILHLTLVFPDSVTEGLQRGASVSIGGVCLTAVEIDGARVQFDLMSETLEKTTLGTAAPGVQYNFERAATFGDEIGGHFLSGHVMGTGEVTAVEDADARYVLAIRVEPSLFGYIFAKGYIAIDGASLTIVEADVATSVFTVHLIPETLRITTLARLRAGDRVNIEVDTMTQAIVETVQRMQLAARSVV